MSDAEFICGLTGRKAPDEDVIEEENDDLEGLPFGWLEVAVRRRVVNPAWIRMQTAKEHAVQGQIQQNMPPEGATKADGSAITAEDRASVVSDIQEIIDATFYLKEKDMPRFLIEEEVVVIYPPERDAAVRKEWDKVAEILDLEIGTEPGTQIEATS